MTNIEAHFIDSASFPAVAAASILLILSDKSILIYLDQWLCLSTEKAVEIPGLVYIIQPMSLNVSRLVSKKSELCATNGGVFFVLSFFFSLSDGRLCYHAKIMNMYA